MRNLKRSTVVLSWLSGAVLAQGIQSRGLSDTLNSILGPGNEGIAKQIEGQLAAGGGQAVVQPVMTTYIIDGPKGAISTVMPIDGVFVTTSIAGTTQGSVVANASAPIKSPAITQPITTLPSAIQNTTTVSVPPPAAVIDSTVLLTQTTQIQTTITPPAAPTFANGSPPPAKQLEPPNSASAPAAPISLTGLPSVVIVTEAPPAASSPAAPIPAPPAASSPSPPAGPGALGLTTGQGKILADGTCGCSCNCDSAAFPAVPAAVAPPGMPVPVANGTTLQTIITPPTSSVSLPSTILVDTNTPPPPPGAQVSSTASTSAQAGSASTIASVSTSAATSSATDSTSAQVSTTASSDTTTQSTTASAQDTTATAASSIRFSLISDGTGGAQVTAAPDLSQAQPQLQPAASIDISKFTLVSSLILGNLGG